MPFVISSCAPDSPSPAWWFDKHIVDVTLNEQLALYVVWTVHQCSLLNTLGVYFPDGKPEGAIIFLGLYDYDFDWNNETNLVCLSHILNLLFYQDGAVCEINELHVSSFIFLVARSSSTKQDNKSTTARSTAMVPNVTLPVSQGEQKSEWVKWSFQVFFCWMLKRWRHLFFLLSFFFFHWEECHC